MSLSGSVTIFLATADPWASTDPWGNTLAPYSGTTLALVRELTSGETQAERARKGTRAGVLRLAEQGMARQRVDRRPRRRVHQLPKLRAVR